MKINVLFFARIAEAVGEREIELELPEGSTVRHAWERIESDHPGVKSASGGAAFAVNEAYVRPNDHILREGDTLAVIPPVSGG